MDVVARREAGGSERLLQNMLSASSGRQNRQSLIKQSPNNQSQSNALLAASVQQNQSVSIDSVELRGDTISLYASQEYSFDESSLAVRPDGTYFSRVSSLDAKQEIEITLDLGPGGAAALDMEAIAGRLESIVSDLQQGFRDSLQDMMADLRSNTIIESAPLTMEDIWAEIEAEMVSRYLVLLKQLGGEDSQVAASARMLGNILDLTGKMADIQSGGNNNLISFNFEIQRETTTDFEVIRVQSGQDGIVQEGEPLVLDLDGDGIELRSMEEGVDFDIDNDGVAERTGFVAGDDGLLALDKNGNGRIDGVAELFGDKTGARNGFEDLARYDDNGDKRIDNKDVVFERLSIFQDKNGDGRSSAGELTTLKQQGITALNLNPAASATRVAGNRITETASFDREDGSKGTIAETYFRYHEL